MNHGRFAFAFGWVVALIASCDVSVPPELDLEGYAVANPASRTTNPGGLIMKRRDQTGITRLTYVPDRRSPVYCLLEIRRGRGSKATEARKALDRDFASFPASTKMREASLDLPAGLFSGYVAENPVGARFSGLDITKGTEALELYARVSGSDLVVVGVGTFSIDPKRERRRQACLGYLKTFHPKAP